MLLIEIKILFVFVLTSLNIFTQEHNDINYTFTQSDTSYAFYGSFILDTNPECLLEISFEFKHVKALNLEAKEVQLIDQGNNWNKISYTYQKFAFFNNQSVWHRKLNKENRSVTFKLVSSKNSHSIMPVIISSSGFFQIKKKGECFIMEYYQQCKLTEELMTKLYLKRSKKEAIKFMYKFYEYAGAYCSNSRSTNN